MGAYWADTFFSSKTKFTTSSSTATSTRPFRFTNFGYLISSRGQRGGAFNAGVWSPKQPSTSSSSNPSRPVSTRSARAWASSTATRSQLYLFSWARSRDRGIQRAPAIRGCRCARVRRVYVEQKLVMKDSTRGCARVLSAGHTSGGQWGLLCQVAKCRRTSVVGYEPESSDFGCGRPVLRFFLVLISGIAARNTSQSQHLGRCSPPPRVVL